MKKQSKKSKGSVKALKDYGRMLDRACELLHEAMPADRRVTIAPDPDAIEKAARAYVAEKWPDTRVTIAVFLAMVFASGVALGWQSLEPQSGCSLVWSSEDGLMWALKASPQ